MTLFPGHTGSCTVEQIRELPGLSIRATHRSADTHVLVRGILDIDNAHALHELAIDCLSRARPLIIDIKGAVSTDTAGAAVLLHIYAVARESGCLLSIVNPVPSVNKVLALLHLDRILPVYPAVMQG